MGVELSLQRLQANLKTSARMPLVFLGHGSPMNAIEDTAFSRSWTELGRIMTSMASPMPCTPSNIPHKEVPSWRQKW